MDKRSKNKLLNEFEKLELFDFKIKTDKQFANNIEANYALCEKAEQVAELLPEFKDTLGESDYLGLRVKVDKFLLIREYLDAKSRLMMNPFYVLLARRDANAIPTKELEKKAKSAENEKLKDYYRCLKKVREYDVKSLVE